VAGLSEPAVCAQDRGDQERAYAELGRNVAAGWQRCTHRYARAGSICCMAGKERTKQASSSGGFGGGTAAR
jgi:hypothetical protein